MVYQSCSHTRTYTDTVCVSRHHSLHLTKSELSAPLKTVSARALFEWSQRITGYVQPRVWWVQYFGKRPDEVEGGYTGLHQDWTSWSQEVNGTADSALTAIFFELHLVLH